MKKFSLLNNNHCGLITLTDARVRNQVMLVTAHLPDWNKDASFFLPVESISSKIICAHVLWKMCADPHYVLQFSVHFNINAKTTEELDLNHWEFL